MNSRERIVVAGGGPAGLRAAQRLRELGFDGEIVILGTEGVPPYHRPALSKELLGGGLRWRDLALSGQAAANASWHLALPAAGLDTRKRIIHVHGGNPVRYDGLVIATGSGSRPLPGAPLNDGRVHFLRTLSEAHGLQRALEANPGPTVVVGGGFTGAEIASTLRKMGRDVVVVSRSNTLFRRSLGPEVGEILAALHQDHGVQLALESDIQHWLPRRPGLAVHLSDGRVLVAGSVVVAVGAAPQVGWLRGSGLTLDDGVLCEPTCHVAGMSDAVAAGDVACWPNLRFDAVPRRLEHWINAVEMGRAAAESLLAGRGRAQPFTPVPRFWSEQHGVRVQAAGMPTLGDDTITIARDNSGDRVLTGYVRNGRLVGVVGLNCPRAMLHWTAELDRQPATTVPPDGRGGTVPIQRGTETPANGNPPTVDQFYSTMDSHLFSKVRESR